VLPQGIKPATDIFKQHMGALFFDMPIVVVYMGDTIIFGFIDFGTHLIDIREVLKCLKEAGMQVRQMHVVSIISYLPWFTDHHQGIKPQQEKVQGILNVKRPKT
jgi:hypothetical protein